MWQERERALRDLFLARQKNNTFLCHCYKQYGSECISPASSWGLWMISRKQCCVYESSRRHTSQWCRGGRHLDEAAGRGRAGEGRRASPWNPAWALLGAVPRRCATPRLSHEVLMQHWPPRRLAPRHGPRGHPPCITYANLVFCVDLNNDWLSIFLMWRAVDSDSEELPQSHTWYFLCLK